MNDELGFNSKIDLWLMAVSLTAVAVCVLIAAGVWDAALARGWLFTAVVAIPLGAGIVLPLWVMASLRYFLSGETLRIRCGPIQWRIAIADIRSVTPTREPWSSPALSLDRLRIEYGAGRNLMISPEPRAEFLRQLEYRRAQKAPQKT